MHFGFMALIAASAAGLPAAAAAQTAPMKSEFRLTDEQIAQVLRDAEGRPQRPQMGESRGNAQSNPVHGEVGVGIGTGGYRSLYGGFEFGDGQSGGAAWMDMDWYVQRSRAYGATAN